MSTRIAIDCLKCGHCTSVAEEKLTYFGLLAGHLEQAARV